MLPLTPVVVDIFHGDIIEGQKDGSYSGFAKLKAAGFRGVIHKATQGVASHDPEYARRREFIVGCGLLHGAYDFNTGDPVKDQVAYFFKTAVPCDTTLCAIDFEDNTHSQMSLSQLVEYLQRADDILGRPFWIYSGNRIKETIVRADAKTRDFLALHPLWLCEYGATARLLDAAHHPLPWSKWTLWQRDADGSGPDFHNAPGILTKNIDLNVYAGGPDQLLADWTGAAVVATTKPTSVPTTATAPRRQINIVATCFGGDCDPEASAYGGKVDPSAPGCALPFHFAKPGKVRVFHGEASVICDVVDVGPHNTDDPYWQAPGARPRAERQGGNRAGIDLTPAAFKALGVDPKNPSYGLMAVDWEFAE